MWLPGIIFRCRAGPISALRGGRGEPVGQARIPT
jgi:hypothetical protein